MSASDPVLIIDYGMGNVGSIANMIKKIGGKAEISAEPALVTGARKLILPGVGAFDAGMSRLKERGLIDILHRKALTEKTPILGICLGMQLLTRRSEEGSLPGLGWIDAETRRFRFDPPAASLRIPHMGWNSALPRAGAPLFRESSEPWRFYFVHSYHVCCADPLNVLCTTTYGSPFTSGVARDNILGVQFHPEKSHAYGMRLLKAFLEL